MSFKIFTVSVLGVSTLALAACQVPHAFPTGYVHHASEYKSPTPPPSSKFTSLQRSTMGPEQSSQFRLAVYDLVNRLTTRAGMSPKPVYVLQPETMTPFYSNMDNDLRESLRHIGYQISDTPEGAYIITYAAAAIEPAPLPEGAVQQPIVVSSRENNMVPNVRMAIHVHDGLGETSKILTQEEGAYYVRGADVMVIPYADYTKVFIPALDQEYRTVPLSVKE